MALKYSFGVEMRARCPKTTSSTSSCAGRGERWGRRVSGGPPPKGHSRERETGEGRREKKRGRIRGERGRVARGRTGMSATSVCGASLARRHVFLFFSTLDGSSSALRFPAAAAASIPPAVPSTARPPTRAGVENKARVSNSPATSTPGTRATLRDTAPARATAPISPIPLVTTPMIPEPRLRRREEVRPATRVPRFFLPSGTISASSLTPVPTQHRATEGGERSASA